MPAFKDQDKDEYPAKSGSQKGGKKNPVNVMPQSQGKSKSRQ